MSGLSSISTPSVIAKSTLNSTATPVNEARKGTQIFSGTMANGPMGMDSMQEPEIVKNMQRLKQGSR